VVPAARAAALIAALGLRPHPEGGHYAEIYRSATTIQPGDGRSGRAALTTIYFLLQAGEHSALHRVASDEVWHFYEGAPLELSWWQAESDSLRRHTLGPAADHRAPVVVVPAGWWQAARTTGAFTLVGCTVAPGFDFADFTLMREDLDASAAWRSRHPDRTDLL
jgi:uncharacterized protein